MPVCDRCHRPLTDAESVRLGMGRICRSKAHGDRDGSQRDGTVAELPFDPETMDIVCRRVDAGERNPWDGKPVLKTQFNINQAVVWHSPTGFEWGYGGSGPADFALNVLNLFVPPRNVDSFQHDDPYLPHEPVDCFNGQCSRFAAEHHQDFKNEFIATMPHEGGTIYGREVKEWIAARLHAGAVS